MAEQMEKKRIIAIAVHLKDSIKNPVITDVAGYRLLDTETMQTKDCARDSVLRMACSNINSGINLCVPKDLKRYTRLVNGSPVGKKRYTYLEKLRSGSLLVCDYTGKTKEVKCSEGISMTNADIVGLQAVETDYVDKRISPIDRRDEAKIRESFFERRFVAVLLNVENTKAMDIIYDGWVYDLHKMRVLRPYNWSMAVARIEEYQPFGNGVKVSSIESRLGQKYTYPVHSAAKVKEWNNVYEMEEIMLVICENKWVTWRKEFTVMHKHKEDRDVQDIKNMGLGEIAGYASINPEIFRGTVQLSGDTVKISTMVGEEIEYSLSGTGTQIETSVYRGFKNKEDKEAMLGKSQTLKIDSSGCVKSIEYDAGEKIYIPDTVYELSTGCLKSRSNVNPSLLDVPGSVRIAKKLCTANYVKFDRIRLHSSHQYDSIVYSLDNLEGIITVDNNISARQVVNIVKAWKMHIGKSWNTSSLKVDASFISESVQKEALDILYKEQLKRIQKCEMRCEFLKEGRKSSWLYSEYDDEFENSTISGGYTECVSKLSGCISDETKHEVTRRKVNGRQADYYYVFRDNMDDELEEFKFYTDKTMEALQIPIYEVRKYRDSIRDAVYRRRQVYRAKDMTVGKMIVREIDVEDIMGIKRYGIYSTDRTDENGLIVLNLRDIFAGHNGGSLTNGGILDKKCSSRIVGNLNGQSKWEKLARKEYDACTR